MITPINNSAVSPQTVGFVSSPQTISPAARHAINAFQSSMEGGLLNNVRKHVTKLFTQLIDQVSGSSPSSSRFDGIMERSSIALQVRGIADRAPPRHFRDAYEPQGLTTHTLNNPGSTITFNRLNPNRDSVFLGKASDYAQTVIAVRVGDDIKPVRHENGQIVARHLNLGNAYEMPGALILADGSEIPLHIDILRAI